MVDQLHLRLVVLVGQVRPLLVKELNLPTSNQLKTSR